MQQKSRFSFNTLLEEKCIYALQKFHKGKEKAIKHKILAEYMGINPRRLRALVSHLVTDHKIPIGSLSKSDVGIFYIANKKEMERAYTELMSRSYKIVLRAFALKQAYLKSIKDKYKLKLFDI